MTCDEVTVAVRQLSLKRTAEVLLAAARDVEAYDRSCDGALAEVLRLSVWLRDRAERNRIA